MRNVIVTGGSRGLGLGIVKKLTGEGYRAIAIARKSNGQLAAAMEETKSARKGALDERAFDDGAVTTAAEPAPFLGWHRRPIDLKVLARHKKEKRRWRSNSACFTSFNVRRA